MFFNKDSHYPANPISECDRGRGVVEQSGEGGIDVDMLNHSQKLQHVILNTSALRQRKIAPTITCKDTFNVSLLRP